MATDIKMLTDHRAALELLQQTAVQAAKPQVLNIDDHEQTRQYVAIGGAIQDVTVLPPPRQFTVLDVDSLARIAVRPELAPDPVIWYDGYQVVLVLDQQHNRGSAVLLLERTQTWHTLSQYVNGDKTIDQAGLVQLLRVGLSSATVTPSHLLAIVRKIKFDSASVHEGQIANDGSSFGNKIEAKVTGAEALPEEVTVTFPLYVLPELSELAARIELALVPDLNKRVFRFYELNESVRIGFEEALAVLRTRIEGAVKFATAAAEKESGVILHPIPIFYGRP